MRFELKLEFQNSEARPITIQRLQPEENNNSYIIPVQPVDD